MMRLLIVAAACAALAGCVTSEPPGPPPPPAGFNPEHDNHCRSLAMSPGSLVYIQCRLAMSQTQRTAERGARQLLTQELGFVSPELDLAMRDDVFCNFNESSKLAVQQVTPPEGAFQAHNACPTTRARLERQVRSTLSPQAENAVATYNRVAIATNESTIVEARTFH